VTVRRFEAGYLAEALQRRLTEPAKRVDKRFRFVPQLGYGRHRGPAPPGTRPAAVVVLLYPRSDGWFIPFTLRPQTLSVHAGQVSLPGGASELGESAEQCGLRELEEEIGVPADQVSILGKLSPIYVYRSQFLVQPLVAIARQTLQFRPDRAEVEQLLEVPVDQLLDVSNYGSMWIVRNSLRYQTPCFRHEGLCIWGATLKVVGEFLDLALDIFGS
jgi:8-oxo-dGTP pyrophosphatase MutT (NUDIX family)